jgi:hypothetical protein
LNFIHGFDNESVLILGLGSFKSAVEEQVLVNCHLGPVNIELGAETDLELNLLELLLDIVASDPGVSRSRLEHSSELRNESGLACTIGSEEAEHLALLDEHRNILVGRVWRSVAISRVDFSDLLND